MRGKKRIPISIILLCLGFALLLFQIKRQGYDDIYSSFTMANLNILFLVFLLISLVLLVKIIRLKVLFGNLNFKDTCKLYFVTQALNEVSILGTGEIVGIYLGKSRHNIDKSKTFSVFTINRFFDFLYLTILTTLSLYFFFNDEIDKKFLLLPVSVVMFLFLIIYNRKTLNLFSSLTKSLDKAPFLYLSRALYTIENSMQELNTDNKRGQKLALLLTFLAWLIDGFSQWFILYSLGFEISLVYLYFIISTTWLLSVFSFVPGGLGVKEYIFVLLLKTQAVAEIISLTAILIQRIFLYIIFFSGFIWSGYSYSMNKKLDGFSS